MCSHLDLIVTYEIIDEDARESSEVTEEASGSRRENKQQNKDTIHKSLPNI